MPRPRVIFFDAGGTLFAPHPSVGAIYAEVARRFGHEFDALGVQRAFDRAFARRCDRAVAERRPLFGFTANSAWDFWRDVLGDTFAELGESPAAFEPIFDRLYEEFSLARRYALVDGALETLDSLHAHGHRVGLISNWDHRLRRILAGLDLERRLDPIVISCEVRAEKPDPAIFHAALRAAGAAPPEALMVGDSPYPDIEGARAVGMPGVLLDLTGWYTGPLPKIDSLTSLQEWISRRDGAAR